jgi:hypothetical protein
MTAPYPAPAAPPYEQPRTRSRAGTVVVVVLVGVILLCLGVGTTGYFLVARIPAGAATPAAAADGLLGAIFRLRDEKAASRYVCAKQRDANSVGQLISEAAQYQGPGESVRWAQPRQTSRSGTRAKVETTLTTNQTVNGEARSSRVLWRFDAVNEHGWRICAIRTGPRR